MDARNEGWNEGIRTAVSMLKDTDMSKEAVIEKIEVSYAMSKEKLFSGKKKKQKESSGLNSITEFKACRVPVLGRQRFREFDSSRIRGRMD